MDAFPAMKVRAIGYGTGTQKLEIPNIIRIAIGEARHQHKKH